MPRLLKPLRALLAAPVKAFSELKLLGVLLLADLGTALVMAAPLLFPLLSEFGRSLSGRGRPFPSAGMVAGLARVLTQGTRFASGPFLLSLLLAFALHLTLSGGIVWRLCAGGPFTLTGFAGQCARLLGRNLRLLGWALLGLLPLVGVAVGAGALLTWAGRPTLFNLEDLQWLFDDPFTGWNVAHLALVALLFVLWRASFDLARVQLYADDERRTRLAAWRALKHLARSPGALLGYAGVALLGLAGVLALMNLHAAVQVTSAARAWLALLLAQAVVVARLGFSVATTAFAVDVHRAMPPRERTAGVNMLARTAPTRPAVEPHL